MRVAALTVLIGSGLLIAVLGASLRHTDANERAVKPRDIDLMSSGGMIALSAECGESHNQVTVIDTKTQVMSVYHVERLTGKISLRSVRNIQWDLKMEEFNGDDPLPQEIRELLGRR